MVRFLQRGGEGEGGCDESLGVVWLEKRDRERKWG